MSEAYEPAGAPSQPKAKRGCLGTSFIILGIVAGVFMLICCGGGAFLYFKFRGVVKSEPAEIVAVQEKIVGIEIPEEMRPAFAMDIDFFCVFSMQWAIFGDQVQVDQAQQQDGSFRGKFLMLMQMQVRGEDPDTMEPQLRNQANSMGVNIDIEERETKTVEIAGEEVDFEFAQGTNREDDSPVRMVNGVFPSRGGMAMLMIVVPEEQWNEEEAMTLLQSISK